MKVKLALIITLFALCNIIFAQPYNIRADASINLRSCAGTNCDVVETVPAGTVLQVVGRFNRWLKISRNSTEVWMADWVNFTRVQGNSAPAVQPAQPAQQPVASQPQGEVDNYCFTIWTCTTEEDWIRGYNAYQNNQGSAAPQVQVPVNVHNQYYRFEGHGSWTTHGVYLGAGRWESRLTTNDFGIVHAHPPTGQRCFYRYLDSYGHFNNKWGGTPFEVTINRVYRNCTVSLEVSNNSDHWVLELTKVG